MVKDSSLKPLFIPALLISLPLSAVADAEPRNWAVTVYHNVLSADPIEDLLTGSADYDSDFQLTALALTRTIPVEDPRYDLEWELQVAKHVEGQDHSEFNGLVAARWYPLPWDKYINTDLAVGLGLSYATEVPEFEALSHTQAEKFLAYILIEAEFKPVSWDNWSVVLRSHHRSGIFGLFNNVRGASNSMGLGIKYRF